MNTLRYDHPNGVGCAAVRSDFSAYLDSAMSGIEMAAIQAHLDDCHDCSQEFALWRDVQRSLGELGPATMPARLQMQLRGAIAAERSRESYLPVHRRLLHQWQSTIAPAALRVAGGFAAALVIVAGLGYLFAAPIAVQANDDRLANLTAARYLYSQVPPQPIRVPHDEPILVEALVNEQGRVYDYNILTGPRDQAVELQVADNLLASVFKPASLFGVPVRGHVVLTYTGVSVHG
jgi:anti-sigma factor RsiW